MVSTSARKAGDPFDSRSGNDRFCASVSIYLFPASCFSEFQSNYPMQLIGRSNNKKLIKIHYI